MPSQAVLELLITLKDQASSGLSSLGGALKTVGGIAGGVALAGVVAFGAAIVGGVGDAREAAKIYAQTENVIRSTGGAAGVTADQVSDLAASLSAAKGASLFGDDQIQESANLLLTFTNLKGGVLDAATAMSVDLAQAMGGAPKDAAIQLGKALNDPVAGISALSRVGVSFTEEQKEQIKTMQEAGDTAGAQAIILAELNKEFGGSAQAAADADGGWAQFNDRLGEAAETVGAALLPLIAQLGGFLLDTIVPAIEVAATAMAAWLADPAVQAGIQQIGDAITTGLGAAFDFIANQAIPALMNAWAIIQPAIESILPLFSGEVPASLGQAGEAFTLVGGIVTSVMELIRAIVAAVLPAVAAFWAAHGDQIQAIVKAAWDYTLGIITSVLGLIQGIIKTVTLAIQGDWSGAWAMLKETSATFVQSILDTVSNALRDLLPIFEDVIDDIQGAWDSFIAASASIGIDIIQGIINGVEGARDQLIAIMIDMAKAAWDAVKEFFGIASPSQLMADTIGGPLIEGIGLGVLNALPSLLGTMNSVATDIINSLKNKSKENIKAVLDQMNDLIGQVEDIAGQVQKAMAAGFSAEGSIDRQLAKNLDSIEKVSAGARKFVQTALQDATKVATQFADPATGAKYLKMRSDQIFELARLQDQLNSTADVKERARLKAQYDLILAAQAAEQKAFRAADAGAVNPQQKLWETIQGIIADFTKLNLTESGIALVARLSGLADLLRGPNGVPGSGSSFPLPAPVPAGGGPTDSRGFPTGPTTINIILPAGTTREVTDEVMRRLNNQIAGRR